MAGYRQPSNKAVFRRLWSVSVVVVLGIATAFQFGPLYVRTASAATGDIGYQDGSTSGTGSSSATGSKPESKLWFTQDNIWWSWMWNGSRYDIARLDPTTHSWMLQGLNISETRGDSRADALYDPQTSKLDVGSHTFAGASSSATTGNPSLLFQFTYSTSTQHWSLDSGYPSQINNTSSETMVIDKDSTGRIWATWTQEDTVYVNWTTTSTNTWATPIALPVAAAKGLDPDDISTLVSYENKSRIGILWSDQTASAQGTALYFASIAAGASDQSSSSSWTSVTAYGPGPGFADDHLNIKSLDSDGSGRVYAVVKTSADNLGNNPSATQIALLWRSAGGTWSMTTVGRVQDCHTRPVLVLDPAHSLLHVYLTAPGTCNVSGYAGTIYEKTANLDSPSFASGRGTPVIRDAASQKLNNVTTTKQEITARSGIVLLASNSVTQRYWHAEESIGTPPPSSGISVVSQTSTVSPATTAATIVESSGAIAGDVLVASLTVVNINFKLALPHLLG